MKTGLGTNRTSLAERGNSIARKHSEVMDAAAIEWNLYLVMRWGFLTISFTLTVNRRQQLVLCMLQRGLMNAKLWITKDA